MVQSLLQCKNLERSVESTVRLKAASDEKFGSGGSKFHTVMILHGKKFLRMLPKFSGLENISVHEF